MTRKQLADKIQSLHEQVRELQDELYTHRMGLLNDGPHTDWINSCDAGDFIGIAESAINSAKYKLR